MLKNPLKIDNLEGKMSENILKNNDINIENYKKCEIHHFYKNSTQKCEKCIENCLFCKESTENDCLLCQTPRLIIKKNSIII